MIDLRLHLRKALKRVAPRRVRSWYRARLQRRQCRTNGTVLLPRGLRRRRWIRGTPDTYRVGLFPANIDFPRFDPMVGDTSEWPILAHGTNRNLGLAIGALAASSADVAVVGVARIPGRFGWWRLEPVIEPDAIAVTRVMFAEVGGAPSGPDLVGLHRRVRDAGGRIAVVPIAESSRVAPRRRDPIGPPAVVILAAVPMHDIGGGSRSAQLALELVRRGFHVVYVSLFGTQESVDLGVRFIHPHLEQYRLDEFDGAAVAARVAHSGLVVLEVPSPTLEPAWTALRLAGWTAIYDAVDRWADPALGGDWYREAVERRICAVAELVLASAPDLVDHVRSLGATAVLVPNAVNRAVFGRDPGPVPGDFPVGNGPVFGYHGSLYGDWFSWGGLEEVARHYPEARVVVIGDVPRSAPEMPGNVHLLGLKSQDSLPDYLAQFDVGLLPFEVTATTHAVSPLKVFEYLASGIPVAAPPLRALQGIAGVVTAPRLVEAVDLARALPRPDRIEALRSHSWEDRVGRILDALDWEAPPEATLGKVVTRPAVHYARYERRL